MPLYTCRFCDYTNIIKTKYFSHLNKHIDEYADSIEPEELELCKFYHNKRAGYMKEYRQTNKDKITEHSRKYYQNNREQLYQRKKKYLKEYRQNNKEYLKEYRLRKKLEKQQVEDIDELIIDCD
jgi:hypothetical protein